MKQCIKCNEVKELTEFYKRKKSPDGRYNTCKSCASQHAKNSYAKNRDHVLSCKRTYGKANRKRISAYYATYYKERYHSDPAFRVLANLRTRLGHALNGNSKSASTIELLGCTPEHARFHIESQFTEGMTWDNIHIDHIQPCASFDLEDPNEQRKCFHYTNLQPLLAEDNLRKSDQIVPEHQVRLL